MENTYDIDLCYELLAREDDERILYLIPSSDELWDMYENGEFDNLSGKGEPLSLEDDSHIPEELRVAYKILKNANVLPPEIELAKDIQSIESLLSSITDEGERYQQIKILNNKIMKFNLMRNSAIPLEKQQFYYKKLVKRFSKDM